MKTYQDLQKVVEKGSEKELISFVRNVIDEYKSSDMYKIAVLADEYDRHQNRTIIQYQKMLYTLSGTTVPDNISANYKLISGHFPFIVNQQNQFLLGNGINWSDKDFVESKVGDSFDNVVQMVGYRAIVHGISYGFFDKDHVVPFHALEFAPLFDEYNGSLSAGVRWWQIDDNKPLRATLYEIDGYTEMMWDAKNKGVITQAKRPYILFTKTSAIEGTEIYDGSNYPTFPIVPCYANRHKQSELIGRREQIDCYDLIKSGFANDLDDASQIYWTLQNAGGMDDTDLATFIQHMKTVHAAIIEDDGASAEAHTLEVPYAARDAILDRLDADIYRDFMALNPALISDGAVTATQIKAAYEPLNNKTDGYEYCIIDFLDGILEVAGIEGEEPSFKRSMILNDSEELQNTLDAAPYLPREYVVKRILTIFGDGDKADDIIGMLDSEDYRRLSGGQKTSEK